MKAIGIFLKRNLSIVAVTTSALCMFALIAGGWFALFPAGVLIIYAYLIAKVFKYYFKRADREDW